VNFYSTLKNTTLRFYYLSYWLMYFVAIFGTHLKMELLLNTPSLSFFVSRIREKCERILGIYNWNNLVLIESYFQTFSTIEKEFTWTLGILIMLPLIIFAIVDVLCPTFCVCLMMLSTPSWLLENLLVG
jgi:hypothetical protein